MASAMLTDLDRSGLAPIDLDARALDLPERDSTGISPTVNGYVIPYYNIEGKMIPFYRVRCFNSTLKYVQPKNTGNHVYFPKGFKQTLNGHNYVVLTEGEKKAALATKKGIPTVALGGVDSWRNRTIVMADSTQLKKSGNTIIAKLNSGEPVMEGASELADGMQELMDMLVDKKLNLIIAYDSDNNGNTQFQVQRAAATLGFELRFHGVEVHRIRQLVLPNSGTGKTGLDDYIEAHGEAALEQLIAETLNKRSAFPRHPNVKEYVSKRLQRSKLTRKEISNISMAILTDLDSKGVRIRSDLEGQLYYFDEINRRLLKASISQVQGELITDRDFQKYLYTHYGLSPADSKVMQWLATQYSAEEPIEVVQPHKVVTANRFIPNQSDNKANNLAHNEPDCIRYQINDGQYVKVTPFSDEPIQICDNGFEAHLFEAGQVQPMHAGQLETEFKLQMAEALRDPKGFKPWWLDVLNDVRLRDNGIQNKTIISMLYYLSPFINKWRGTQLPIELVLGESGSGKSSLYSVRLQILTGEAILRNAPNDIKDWHATITHGGGLLVTDNVQLTDKILRQKMSDDICRIVTEPNPFIEMRKYYTNNELLRIPVQSTFAVTAIQQPFQATDLLQRAILVELDKTAGLEDNTQAIDYDQSWVATQISKFGGRVAWFAHHLVALHLFLREVQTTWDHRYKAKHRLINFEQSPMIMCRVFNIEPDWIPDFLTNTTNDQISDSDWALQGMVEYAEYARELIKSSANKNNKHMLFGAKEIAEWAREQEDYENCQQLTNGRKLGRYFSSHKQQIAMVAGITEAGTSNNRQMFKVTLDHSKH